MASRFRFALVVFFFAGTLIAAVSLRGGNYRVFNTLARHKMEQGRLRQELWQKQLRLESLINPAAISQRLDR